MASIAAIAINDDKCPKGTVPDTSALKLNNSAPRLGDSEKWRFESVDGATVVPSDL